jgi:gliding motility-associated lipoprotein GldH
MWSRLHITWSFVLAVSIGMISWSCDREKVLFSETAGIGVKGWAYADSIPFTFHVADTLKYYDLILDVTHARDYAWENAYVQITTVFPGDSTKTDLVSLELSDGAGAWIGRCGRKTCTLAIPLQGHFRFPFPGSYSLTFTQYMRQDVIPGILSLRLQVIESGL